MGVVGHTEFHFAADIQDDLFIPVEGWLRLEQVWREKTVPWRETVDLFNDSGIFDEELSIFFVWAAHSVVPTWSDGVFMECVEDGLLDVVGDGHVVFDSVKAVEDGAEETYLEGGDQSFGVFLVQTYCSCEVTVELLDDGGETAACPRKPHSGAW